MKPQLTLQTPLELPPQEVSNYLDKLWISENDKSSGANTFSLIVWQPSWLEQYLVKQKYIQSPITGNLTPEIISTAKDIILKNGLSLATSLYSEKLTDLLKSNPNENEVEDLRGQFFESSISSLNPRRLITLAPTLNDKSQIKTFVSAYCPLSDDSTNQSICGDLVVVRGNTSSIHKTGLKIIEKLEIKGLPSWLWWNSSLDDSPEIFEYFAKSDQRLIIDTANGSIKRCITVLNQSISSKKAINDLNWLRLKSWRESLAMIFDPPHRRPILSHIKDIDVDIEGSHYVQALFLISWISKKLNWEFTRTTKNNGSIQIIFSKNDKEEVTTKINPLEVGTSSIHSGQVVGLRLISKVSSETTKNTCIILGSESVECMRLEAGGMADMQLIEEVVPNPFITLESDVSQLLKSSRGNTSPLFEETIEIVSNIFESLS